MVMTYLFLQSCISVIHYVFVCAYCKACHEATRTALLPISECLRDHQEQQETVPILPSTEMPLNRHEEGA